MYISQLHTYRLHPQADTLWVQVEYYYISIKTTSISRQRIELWTRKQPRFIIGMQRGFYLTTFGYGDGNCFLVLPRPDHPLTLLSPPVSRLPLAPLSIEIRFLGISRTSLRNSNSNFIGFASTAGRLFWLYHTLSTHRITSLCFAQVGLYCYLCHNFESWFLP